MTEKALEEVVTETAEAAEETTQENSGAASDKAKKMTKQDENWELVTFLNFTWSEATSVKGADRKYLLNKSEEVKLEVLRRRKLEMEQAEREEMMRQQQQAQQQHMMEQQQVNNPPHTWQGQ